jgi:hypothetical protein
MKNINQKKDKEKAFMLLKSIKEKRYTVRIVFL